MVGTLSWSGAYLIPYKMHEDMTSGSTAITKITRQTTLKPKAITIYQQENFWSREINM